MYKQLEEAARAALARGETSKEKYYHANEQEQGGFAISADFTRAQAAIMARLEEKEKEND